MNYIIYTWYSFLWTLSSNDIFKMWKNIYGKTNVYILYWGSHLLCLFCWFYIKLLQNRNIFQYPKLFNNIYNYIYSITTATLIYIYIYTRTFGIYGYIHATINQLQTNFKMFSLCNSEKFWFANFFCFYLNVYAMQKF